MTSQPGSQELQSTYCPTSPKVKATRRKLVQLIEFNKRDVFPQISSRK